MARRIGVALAVIAALVLVAELVVRLPPVSAALAAAFRQGSLAEQEIKRQQEAGDRRRVADPELGNRAPPLRRDTMRTPDFTYVVETDSAGFPNREPWPARADVVVLGNSLVIGPGVGIDGQFSTLLAKKLGGAAVLNLGYGGVAPELEYRIYRRYGAARRPRVVLVCLWVASDVDNALHFDRWLAEGRPDDFYKFRTGYGVTHAGASARRRAFLKQARLMSVGAGVVKLVERRRKYVERVEFPSGEEIYLSGRALERLATGMTRPDWPRLRDAFFTPLTQLRDTVEADGGRLVVVLIPSKEELYGTERFPAALAAVDEVRAGLARAGLRTIDLYDPIRRGAGDASPFFRRDIHLNALGNDLAAAAIAEWLITEDLSP